MCSNLNTESTHHPTNKDKAFKCTLCIKSYRTKQSLANHKSKDHKQNKAVYECNFCNYTTRKYLTIVNHNIKKHSKKHCYNTSKFTNEEEASKTLEHLMNNGKYGFIQTTGPKKLLHGLTSYFTCVMNRQKQQCGCFIRYQITEKIINITYFDKHLHDPTIAEIRLSKKIKNELMHQLIIGVPLKKIHQKIIQNFNISNFSKYQTITKNYLRYLRKMCSKFTQYAENDIANSKLYLKNLKNINFLTKYIFKDKGQEAPGYPQVTDNFIIALQTTNQKISFDEESSKHVMVDSTHGTNIYNHYLITFGILTKKQRFLPVLWIISDSDSENTVGYVLRMFKMENLLPLTPTIMMSDMSPVYINSWTNNVTKDISWFYCQWHLKKAISKNLLCKIKNKEIRKVVEEKFETLCRTTDEQQFNRKYKSFFQYIEKNNKSFYDYFFKYYHECQQRWAPPQRKTIELNTNMFLEAFHSVLKNTYLDRRSNHRIDHLLMVLSQYDSDRAWNFHFSNFSANKELQGHREKIAGTKHKLGMKLKKPLFKKRGDRVYYKRYIIKPGLCVSCPDSCVSLCRKCNICKDRLICSCNSFLIRKEMCKHIHMACFLFIKSNHESNHKIFTNKGNGDKNENNMGKSQLKRLSSSVFMSYEVNSSPYIERNVHRECLIPNSICSNEIEIDSEQSLQWSSNKECEAKQPSPAILLSGREKRVKVESIGLSGTSEVYNALIHSKQGYRIDSECFNKEIETTGVDENSHRNDTKVDNILQMFEKIRGRLEQTESVIYISKIEELTMFMEGINEYPNEFPVVSHEIDKKMNIKPLTQRSCIKKRINRDRTNTLK